MMLFLETHSQIVQYLVTMVSESQLRKKVLLCRLKLTKLVVIGE